MAVTIISESYGPRKPFVVCTAASTDELADYAGLWAEGSEATISTTKYVLDRTKGWVEDGGGGGGGGSGVLRVGATVTDTSITLDKTWKEIHDAGYAVLELEDDSLGTVFSPLYSIDSNEYYYYVGFYDLSYSNPATYTTESEDGYPVMSFGG